VAIPNWGESITAAIDRYEQGWNFNASLVNPVAAAIVQFRVVSAALDRRQNVQNA
jgi:hypothetical protein